MIKTEQQLLKVNIILCRLVYIAKKRHLNGDKNHAAILIPFIVKEIEIKKDGSRAENVSSL